MSFTRLLARVPSRHAVLAVFLALTVLSAGVGSAAAKNLGNPNFGSSHVADTYIYEERIDIAAHNNSEMDSVKEFYGDDGDIRTLPVELNESIDNPVIVRLDRIEEDSWRTFPRNSNHSVLDAAEWAVSGQNASKLSVTQSNGSTAPGVTSITIATDGTMSAGDTATAEFTNVSITQDPTKRVPLVGLNVNTLGSNAEGELRFVDADGDFKTFHINSSLNASEDDVIATTTGTGYLTQEKLDNIATDSTNGDGTFDGIESVTLVTADGDIDVTVFAFDAERKSEITVGERLVQQDDDSELETTTIHEVTTPGEQNLSSLDSMGTWADDAIIHQLGVKGLEWRASKLDSEDVHLNLTDAEHGRKPLFTSRQGRPSQNTVRVWAYLVTLPCIHSDFPHDRERESCEYTKRNHASKCPSSRSPHQIRTGSITWQLDCGIPPEVVAARANVSVGTIKKHYDKATPRQRMEKRRRRYIDQLDL